jgi:sigma-54 dependent transcriptional regulator, acetoin dehydrogenase operon transcriptional activator AcoR
LQRNIWSEVGMQVAAEQIVSSTQAYSTVSSGLQVQLSLQRMSAVTQARTMLVELGPQVALPGIEPWIADSWRRCVQSGKAPNQTIGFAPIARQEKKRITEANYDLINVALPSLHTLAGLVSGIGFFAMLTDINGIVIEVAGNVDRADTSASAIAQVGVDLSEHSAGTSAICTALREQHSVWLHQSEHFYDGNGVYSCAGSPLFNPLGQCIGMLDLTGIRVREQRQLIHLVTQYAHQIEQALLLKQPRALLLKLCWPSLVSVDVSENAGLVAIGDSGQILGADRSARLMLPELERLSSGQVHCADLFATPWQSLFDLSSKAQNRQDFALWSGLSIRVQATSFANDRASGTAGLMDLKVGQPNPTLKSLQSQLIRQAVNEAKGNVEEAAKRLGISRATVYRKLNERH